ncbi:WecB/TagA/CpsF family glycosyltransferase [Cryobacterium sp. SO2]|uniref:WecB/TagA/CpsF family glycosyltransferase n=1 Tax=Cryobacterium sp. SO2 TaxID=1897060 RepID=UPI00223D1099|nr:WecB/TagA/CpsF family glycosyltransferase [Cryobacterium sp. SO2]WEO77979.1 WecB/TagA/CpsF family glycosyltransferase [Cryobacterium sp. SO2]
MSTSIENEARGASEQAHVTQWVGPVEFVSSDSLRAVHQILDLVHDGRGVHVHLANAYTVSLADTSPEYRSVLAAPAINFPDGKPIGWTSALRGHSPALRQVRGPQLFLDVFDAGRAHGIKHFLLGSTPEVLASLQLVLADRFPGVQIVGVESPPFRPLSPEELAAQDSRIRDTAADIVWVGLGTPKQDVEAQRLAGSLPIVAVAIGAAFDFAAGTIRPAPAWVTAIGFEWAYRFAREPRRLWKRYVFGNARFVKTALLSKPRPAPTSTKIRG